MLNLIAVGYSLGLAASVLCLGAVGDRCLVAVLFGMVLVRVYFPKKDAEISLLKGYHKTETASASAAGGSDGF